LAALRPPRTTQVLFNVDELEQKAKAAGLRREAAGISDSIEDAQPADAPEWGELVNTRRSRRVGRIPHCNATWQVTWQVTHIRQVRRTWQLTGQVTFSKLPPRNDK